MKPLVDFRGILVLAVLLSSGSFAFGATPKLSPPLNGTFTGKAKITDYIVGPKGNTTKKSTGTINSGYTTTGGSLTINFGFIDQSSVAITCTQTGEIGNFQYKVYGPFDDNGNLTGCSQFCKFNAKGDTISGQVLMYRSGYIRTATFTLKKSRSMLQAAPPPAVARALLEPVAEPRQAPVPDFVFAGKATGSTVDITTLNKATKFSKTFAGSVFDSLFNANLLFDAGKQTQEEFLDCGRRRCAGGLLFNGPVGGSAEVIIVGNVDAKGKFKGNGYIYSGARITSFKFTAKQTN